MIVFLGIIFIYAVGYQLVRLLLEWVGKKHKSWLNLLTFILALVSAYSISFVLHLAFKTLLGNIPTGYALPPILTWLSTGLIFYYLASSHNKDKKMIYVPFLIFGIFATFAGLTNSFNFFVGLPLLFIAFLIYKKGKSGKKDIRRASKTKIDLSKFRAEVKGRPFFELINHHIERESLEQLQMASIGTVKLLDPKIQPHIMSFIDKWNLSGYDKSFYRTDCSIILDDVTKDAQNLLRELKCTADDETLFNMFQIIVLSYAYSASDQPKMREFMGIQKSGQVELFPKEK